MPKANWTTIALIGGLVLLVLVIAYFATRGNADQDKLTNANLVGGAVQSSEKLCASKSTYDLIKRDLFRRAAQVRGSDQAAFDRVSGYSVLRMENPVMESEDSSTGAVHCSGSLSLDLPPGIAVVGGRRTLSSDIDYSVQPAADGSGPVILVSNADAIITPLATLARVAEPEQQAAPEGDNETVSEIPETPEVQSVPQAPSSPSNAGQPSFNCANARTKGEIAVCREPGLASLDRAMATEYGRAMGVASPDQQDLLRSTRDRFLGYRDRCPNSQCIADAYRGRMREIRDIVQGRWQPR